MNQQHITPLEFVAQAIEQASGDGLRPQFGQCSIPMFQCMVAQMVENLREKDPDQTIDGGTCRCINVCGVRMYPNRRIPVQVPRMLLFYSHEVD